jgi:hypothetical protein
MPRRWSLRPPPLPVHRSQATGRAGPGHVPRARAPARSRRACHAPLGRPLASRAHPTLAPRSRRARTVPNRAGRRRRSPLRRCCRASLPAPHQRQPTLSTPPLGPPAASSTARNCASPSPSSGNQPQRAGQGHAGASTRRGRSQSGRHPPTL